MEAFAQSSSDDEVSYSNYNRRIQRRRTQKVAENAISRQQDYEGLFDSGTIDNQKQLHEAVNEQVFVDNLTPDSKKVFFQVYSKDSTSLSDASPDFCPGRKSSRTAKKLENPPNRRPHRFTRCQ